MRTIDPNTENAVRRFIARVPGAEMRVEHIVLYGSRARGDYRPDSDADVALIVPHGADDWRLLWMLSDLAYDVFAETGVMIQPVPVGVTRLGQSPITFHVPVFCATWHGKAFNCDGTILSPDPLLEKSEAGDTDRTSQLDNEDPDSAVNRAYYAMFNMSRAALLEAGVPEGELPRTHRGISDAFRRHAVLTGKIDAGLARVLSRAESLRLMADYTAKEIDARAAAELVEQAEEYVRTVAHVFDLQPSAIPEAERSDGTLVDHTPDKQPSSIETGSAGDEIEEAQRRGREDWLKMRNKQLESGAPTIEEIQAKAREDWLNLRRQSNSRRSKDATVNKEQSRDLGRDVGAKESSKEIDDDVDS